MRFKVRFLLGWYNLSTFARNGLKSKENRLKSKVMAAFSVIGFVEALKPLPDSCILFLSEYKKGYRKSDGTIVDDKYVSWKIIYKGYFIKYLTTHFSKGMLVEVKGEVLPYAIEHGQAVEGVSVIGQTCNIYSYPRYNAKQEVKMIKESQLNSDEEPDLDTFIQPDF